jgi:hypothetical protein
MIKPAPRPPKKPDPKAPDGKLNARLAWKSE